jgi:hypothetical protein
MAKFQMTELLNDDPFISTRLGAGTGAGNQIDKAEVGKPVKLVADSRYDLCAAGDPIEGFIRSTEAATLDNFSVGSIQICERMTVKADGLQATAGTGTIAVGDYVVAGTAVSKGTALVGAPKVCKATYQPGTTVAGALGDVNLMLKVAMFPWRVVSILTGTGAVGDTLVIERVNC